MELKRSARQQVILASVFVAGLGMSSVAFAEDFHGVIFEHGSDGTLTVQADDSSNVVVVMADNTKVRRLDGVRSSKTSAASLVPGLRIEVHGKYSDDRRFAADRVTFRKSDMKIARAIQGGLGPTDQRVAANEQNIGQHAQALRQGAMVLMLHQQQIAATNAKMVATTGMVEANATRISNMDDYNVIGSVTVYFANGKSTVPSKYKDELKNLIAQAKEVHAYVVQVQGYASAVGADTLNERLSSERATAVARVLQQNGVPPTNLVPPAGMGTTDQVAPNKTEKEQAQNRRAVITLLQNKGVAGK
jgi:outer membrane protein OmpA-like peptidoglycan-associated protein